MAERKNRLFSDIASLPHCDRPGMILYLDDWEALRQGTTTEERARLVDAMAEYVRHGSLPDFDGSPALSLSWGFLFPKLVRDQQDYNYTVWKNRYAAYKRDQEKPLGPDQWLRLVTTGDLSGPKGKEEENEIQTETASEKGTAKEGRERKENRRESEGEGLPRSFFWDEYEHQRETWRTK